MKKEGIKRPKGALRKESLRKEHKRRYREKGQKGGEHKERATKGQNQRQAT